MDASNCPKCRGPRDAKALYCPFCGVVFARYLGGDAAQAAPPAAAPPPPPPVFRTTAAAAEAPASVFQGAMPAPAAVPTMWDGGQKIRFDANNYADAGGYSVHNAGIKEDLASPWSRLFAQLLNAGAMLGIAFLFTFAFALVANFIPARPDSEIDAARGCGGLGFLLGLIYWVYTNCQQLSATGQSLGKKWMSIRIVRMNGEQPEVSRLIFARWLPLYLVGSIPALGQIVAIVDAVMVFTPARRCLHDLVADTQVVNC